MLRRVVISGVGSHHLFGGSQSLWHNILNPSSPLLTDIAKGKGVMIDPDDTQSLLVRIGKDVSLPKGKLPSFVEFGLISTWLALKDAAIIFGNGGGGLEDFGVCFGNGLGNPSSLLEGNKKYLEGKRPSPRLICSILQNMPASWISIVFGCKGNISSPSMACTTGTQAIGDAYRLIKDGYCRKVICGASEAPLDPLIMAAFKETKALSADFRCRPFDKGRNGFLMGEGSATIILEELDSAIKRGCRPLVEIVGYGSGCDSHHITESHPEGQGAYSSMKMAVLEGRERMKMKDLKVSFVNAHGTGTVVGDLSELKGIERMVDDGFFERDCRITSQKGQFGHLLGASGALETIIAALSLKNGYWPPTFDCSLPISERIEIEGRLIRKGADYAITNSFGFGGGNASLLLKKFS